MQQRKRFDSVIQCCVVRLMVRTSDCGSDNKGSIPLQHILPLSFIGLGCYPVTVEGRVRLSLRALEASMMFLGCDYSQFWGGQSMKLTKKQIIECMDKYIRGYLYDADFSHMSGNRVFGIN